MDVYINAAYLEHKPLLPSKEHMNPRRLQALAGIFPCNSRCQEKQVLNSWYEE